MTKSHLLQLPRHQDRTITFHRRRSSTSPHKVSLHLLTTFTLMLLLFCATVPFTITPAAALPVLEPRRNPLTLGLSLGGGKKGGNSVGVSLGGGPLLNLHHPFLHGRTVDQPPEAVAEAIAAVVDEKRSSVVVPASGAEADNVERGVGRPWFGPRRGDFHILPEPPAAAVPMDAAAAASSPSENKSRHMEKRQRLPSNPPGSGSNYNKDQPYGRRRR